MSKPRVIFFLLAIGMYLNASHANAQRTDRHADHWLFGDGAALFFENGNQPKISQNSLPDYGATTTYSDMDGNLRLYSNGASVWNGQYQLLENGTDLIKNKFSNYPGLIVPIPESDEKRFLLFNIEETEGNTDPSTVTYPIYYNEIDLSLAGGRGAVTKKREILLGKSSFAYAAVKHCNNKDFWLVTHRGDTNGFLVYLIDREGIHLDEVQEYKVGTPFSRSSVGLQQEIIASENGSLLAISKPVSPDGGFIETFRFNSETGEVVERITTLTDLGKITGVAISPSGDFLFVSRFVRQESVDLNSYQNFYEVVQFRTTEAPKFREQIYLQGFRGTKAEGNDANFQVEPGVFGNLKLGPDGKIYLAHVDDPYLSVIHKPDAIGTASQFQYRGVNLNGKKGKSRLPAAVGPTYPDLKSKITFTGDSLVCNPILKAELDGKWNPKLEYQWYRNQILLEGQTKQEMKVTTSGEYQVIIKDGCRFGLSLVKEINGATPPEKPAEDSTYTSCTGTPLPEFVTTGDGIRWYTDISLKGLIGTSNKLSPPISNLLPQTKTFYATRLKDGCESEAAQFTIELVDNTPLELSDSLILECFTGENKVIPTFTESKNRELEWTRDGQFFSNEMLPEITDYGLYTVKKKDERCPASASLVVKEGCVRFFIPTAFSPNGDGINDELLLFGNGRFVFDFTLIDRQGREVVHLNRQEFNDKPLVLWDGKFAGSPMPSGPYYYVFSSYTLLNDEERKSSSSAKITLLR